MINEPLINPYNSKNILVTSDDIRNLLSKYNITIDDIDIKLFIQSFTHKSYIKKEYYKDIYKYKKDNIIELQETSNERLECLGDAELKKVILEYLYLRYPDANEGDLTKIKTKIEDGKSLARFAKIFGLDKYVLISKQNELHGINRANDKILEDTFEAFIGALYLNSCDDVCNKFIIKILESEVDYSDIIYNDNNYKDQILRYYHSNKWKHPEYILLDEKGTGNKKIFIIGLLDNNSNVIITASDTSKRKAEQRVSKYGLYKFNMLNDEQLNDDELLLINK